jgi:hypothetical protein
VSINISIIKGVHPGLILDRELKKRQISIDKFADGLNEDLEELISVTKGKRNMNEALSSKIEKALNLEKVYLWRYKCITKKNAKKRSRILHARIFLK